jgi:hypothetical protein
MCTAERPGSADPGPRRTRVRAGAAYTQTRWSAILSAAIEGALRKQGSRLRKAPRRASGVACRDYVR